ncbi:MAG TPA: glycosyltransferase family 2 protein [Chthoniobacteraceae bacterium]|jgi:glycosyltransferase involved in cell wall biosynthesis
MSDIRLSVALVTRNRPESLGECLASLRKQEIQPWEIIVSDDSGSAEAAAAVQQVAGEFGAIYRVGPKRGLYANRNAAALACSGTHIRTMDDDHRLPAGHLGLCLEAVGCDPKSLWTTGEVGFIDGKFYDRAEFADQLHPAGVGCAVLDPDDNWAVADGSTIYPREIFERGYRMVEDFTYGMSYLEFGAFLYRRGFRSRCVRGAYVEHYADRATLSRDKPHSRLFASLCYNLHFRPSATRAMRYLIPILARKPSLIPHFRSLAARARTRWSEA